MYTIEPHIKNSINPAPPLPRRAYESRGYASTLPTQRARKQTARRPATFFASGARGQAP